MKLSFLRAPLVAIALLSGMLATAGTVSAQQPCPRPYRYLDFSQPSGLAVVVTTKYKGQVKQRVTYKGYTSWFPEPGFLFYGDVYNHYTYGPGYGQGF